MLKSCQYCGRIHDSKIICSNKKEEQIKRNRKKESKENKFRWTQAWRDKREEIKERDKHMCQICIRNLFNTKYIYNYKNLSVHHATPLIENYNKRLDDNNLLTVCDYHHELCESNIIDRSVVIKIINEQEHTPRG